QHKEKIMNTAEQTNHIVNGIDTEQVMDVAGKISQNEEFGKFKFRANNHWIGDSRSRTSIQGFFAGGEENTGRREALTVDADQPTFLGGKNTAPNSVEHLLHSLTSCLSTTMVYHASVQGITIDELDISAEGDMNAKGFFGISDKVNRGYERIRVNVHVKSDADIETLTKFAMYSPVYEVVSKAVPVDFNMTKI
ncbi:MAG: OsmC family protein, partial [Gammaproteobacteria bacterium]